LLPAAHAQDKDFLEVGSGTDLTALKDVTILDTGLHITSAACDNAKLAAAFSALQEIRGVLKVRARARAKPWARPAPNPNPLLCTECQSNPLRAARLGSAGWGGIAAVRTGF